MPSNRLTVSVLMATYNRADLLPEAIDSLFEQTRLPDEIIVVDDGSTDDTPEILAKYGPPVKVIRQPNRGLPASRNVALRAATGDLIAFLDSDDTLPPNSLALRASLLEARPEVSAVYGGAYMTNLQNQILGWFRTPPLPRGMIFAEVACRVVFPMHSVMFRRECIDVVGYFDEELRVQLDFDYWLRFSAVYPFEAIDQPLAYYRVHDEMSVKTQSEQMALLGIKAQSRAFSMPAFAQLSPKQKARIYVIHGTQFLRLGEVTTARSWYSKAVKTEPRYWLAYGLWIMTFLGKYMVRFMFQLRHIVMARVLKRVA